MAIKLVLSVCSAVTDNYNFCAQLNFSMCLAHFEIQDDDIARQLLMQSSFENYCCD
jgi:hypothetical protein